jgi:hypothetical protein
MSYISDGSRENSNRANREQEAQQRRELFDVVSLCHIDGKNVMIKFRKRKKNVVQIDKRMTALNERKSQRMDDR